jgi:hypothetical protein
MDPILNEAQISAPIIEVLQRENFGLYKVTAFRTLRKKLG